MAVFQISSFSHLLISSNSFNLGLFALSSRAFWLIELDVSIDNEVVADTEVMIDADEEANAGIVEVRIDIS